MAFVFIHSQLYVAFTSRVESGSGDQENLDHLGHFLMGQVGLINKLSYEFGCKSY